jgi:hypothetical protein
MAWHCERSETERRRLTHALTALDVQLGTPVQDLCAMNKWWTMKCNLYLSTVTYAQIKELLEKN